MENRAKREKIALWVGRVLCIAYIAGLCYFLFFAENYGRSFGQENYRYNLVPFKEIERFWKYREELGIHSFYNLAGNVIGFIPAGYMFSELFRKKRGLLFTALITFQMSLGVEILQLVLKVGSFDVDDLILNTFGGILGYLLMKLVSGRRKHEKV